MGLSDAPEVLGLSDGPESCLRYPIKDARPREYHNQFYRSEPATDCIVYTSESCVGFASHADSTGEPLVGPVASRSGANSPLRPALSTVQSHFKSGDGRGRSQRGEEIGPTPDYP